MAAAKKVKEEEQNEPEAEDAEGSEGTPAAEEPKRKKLSGKFLVLFIALPAVAVIAIGIGAAFFLGVFGGKEEKAKDAHEAARAEAEHAVFFDMPELLVNMTGGGEKQQNFLKLSLSLELPNADATPKIQAAMPRIIDSAQVFLRELRLDDLQGSAGMLRLREELMHRINAAVSPVEVRDVLFKEIIVQ